MNESRGQPAPDHLWVVRAGKGSKYADRFREESLVAIGFGHLPDYPADVRREELERLHTEIAPHAPSGRMVNTVSQVLKFLRNVNEGEPVATYDGDRREYLLGTVASSPKKLEDDEAITWSRDVRWERHVSRDTLSNPTRNTLGSALTLFQVRGRAVREVFDKSVPFDTPLEEVEAPMSPPEEDATSAEAEIAAKAEEFIEDRLVRLDWEDLQELVAGILRAMGYQTETSGRGPDRGVDIFASPDGLGLEEPRIFVEVKHRRTTAMGSQEIRSFLGGRQPSDRCLYVSTGGFTKEARYEADRANIPTKLISLPKLRELLLQYYDHLEPEVKAIVPLKRLYWPAD